MRLLTRRRRLVLLAVVLPLRAARAALRVSLVRLIRCLCLGQITRGVGIAWRGCLNITSSSAPVVGVLVLLVRLAAARALALIMSSLLLLMPVILIVTLGFIH